MLDEVFKDFKSAIEMTSKSLDRDLSKVKTGRARAEMLDSVRVDYYGVPTPVHQLATVSVPEPRLITVKPWEQGQVKAVEKAIRESDLGLNAQAQGDLVRIPIPALTEERRKEQVKIAKKQGEESKIAVRKHLRDAQEAIAEREENGEIAGPEAEQARKKLEEMEAEALKQIEAVVAAKEKDISGA